MQTVRIVALASLALVALAGPASAGRINTPGDYRVNVYVDPNFVPPGLPTLGPDVYAGVVKIRNTGPGVRVRFRGKNDAGDKLVINSLFMHGWVGMLLMDMPIGGTMVPNVVVGADISWMMEGRLNGVGTVDGDTKRVLATFGMGGTVEDVKIGRVGRR